MTTAVRVTTPARRPTTVRSFFGPEDHGRVVSDVSASVAEYQPGFRYEIIDGRLFVSPQANCPHDVVRDWIQEALWAYKNRRPDVIKRISAAARVFVPGVARTTAPEPDLAVYNRTPRTSFWKQRWQDLSPFLVVEVVSSDFDKDFVRNVRLYGQVPSIREYWAVFYGESPEEFFFRPYVKRAGRWLKDVKRLNIGDTYSTPILPGFSLLMKPQ